MAKRHRNTDSFAARRAKQFSMPPKNNTKALEAQVAELTRELERVKRDSDRQKRSMFLNQMREFGAKMLQINSACRFKDWQTYAAQQKAARLMEQVNRNNEEALDRAREEVEEQHKAFAANMQSELSEVMKKLKEAKMHNASLKYEEKKLLTQVHENQLEITAKDRALLAERDLHQTAMSETKQVYMLTATVPHRAVAPTLKSDAVLNTDRLSYTWIVSGEARLRTPSTGDNRAEGAGLGTPKRAS